MATSVPLGIVSLKAEGAYAADKLYKKGMWVTSSGSSYAYINPTPATGVPLTETSHWQQIAEKGDTGATGATGPKGDTGDPTSSTASDIPTSTAGVSVQGALDEHTAQFAEKANQADLTAMVESMGVKQLNEYIKNNGSLSTTKTWNNINANYRHIVIPVVAGDKIELRASLNYSLYYGILTAYTPPTNGASVPYSADPSFSDRQFLSANSLSVFEVPSDGAYLVVMVIYNTNDTNPTRFIINDYDILKSVSGNIANVVNNGPAIMAKGLASIINNGIPYVVEWDNGTFTQTIGATPSNTPNAARKRTSVVNNDIPLTLKTDGAYSVSIVYLNAEGLVITVDGYNTETRHIPKNSSFRLTIKNAANDTMDISAITSDEISTHVTLSYTKLSENISPMVNWCVMGDSISQGVASYEEGGMPNYAVNKNKAWAYLLAARNGWNLTNISIGGTGYIDIANDDSIGNTAGYKVARNTDFTPYNLVTIAYGVNDWKANIPIGTLTDDASGDNLATIYSGIKATIEAIMASNPLCKIVVLTPLNCAGYDFSYGSESTNWALGYSFANSGTLENVFDAIVSVCDYYGIQYIDLTHYSCVNRKNLLSCLTDGVHPNAATHKLLMRELCKKIVFG